MRVDCCVGIEARSLQRPARRGGRTVPRSGGRYTVCVVFQSPLQKRHVTNVNCPRRLLFTIIRLLKLIVLTPSNPVA